MEQNKVLMIVISVAVFLAAIVGVGVALLYPRSEDGSTTVAARGIQEFDPIEYVRQPEAEPLTPAEETEEPVIIVYGADDTETQVEVPEKTEPGVVPTPETYEPTGTTQESGVEEPTARTEPRTFGPSPAAVSSPVEESVSETAPSRRTTEYWIQLIASPSRDRVEQAREYLEENSLGGRITTREVEGTTYYRLRVGPYEYREEAEKFLDWIHDGEIFTDAYISEEYPAI